MTNKIFFVAIAGSHAYGLNTNTSDLDIKGVFYKPNSLFSIIEVLEGKTYIEPWALKVPELCTNGYEGSLYNLDKFIKLAAQCNPNIIELLFLPESKYLEITSSGQKLLDARREFLSTKVKFTYTGYATSQLHRIETHRRWLLNPPEEFPQRSTFGLPEKPTIEPSKWLEINAMITKEIDSWEIDFFNMEEYEKIKVKEQLAKVLERYEQSPYLVAAKTIGLEDNLRELVAKESLYRKAIEQYKSYQTWKTTRNPKRFLLEQQYHYDTKHASHLVRLLRQGKELLETGNLIADRTGLDADELISIRNGAWTYEQLMAYTEKLNRELDEFYLSGKSPLPKVVNYETIDKLFYELIQ